MSTLVRNIVRFILFILVQVFVLNQIPPLHHLVVPYLYFLFILWLPFKTGRRTLLVLGFLLGFSLDAFTGTFGLHSAPCVVIAYLRPFLIKLLLPREEVEVNFREPSAWSLGVAPYLTYVTILTFVHHTILFFLQALQTGGLVYFLVKSLFSTAVSLLLVLLTELLFNRKQGLKVNLV
ncbi:MAG TPA: rod shape-determining protein MreD [Ginsengibacter sp.]|nr:rod shape-determining protein MreD [Chitinophagaceae bacterium]MCZ2395205.1 rod shape-determining protein MreD [Chitinophagales bacterium]HRN72548.1 rod shape-determining protein MreD [Ginsengibacter sp.]MCO5286743.1 rod shape-determining protein MreD [Chitinophagaceae bacterium]MCW5914680.1 rod shape-determining protein MreD [Chitinophagaceae bacterium]